MTGRKNEMLERKQIEAELKASGDEIRNKGRRWKMKDATKEKERDEIRRLKKREHLWKKQESD